MITPTSLWVSREKQFAHAWLEVGEDVEREWEDRWKQSFIEEMKLQLIVNIDNWFGGEEEANGWRLP